jgi:peptidoglycan/xylan/chitin deacetylase (PgdA/CDA1 family)
MQKKAFNSLFLVQGLLMSNIINILLKVAALTIALILIASPASASEFSWPQGIRAGISITFDDARASQLDVGIPLLNRYEIKATFYVLPDNIKSRLSDWQEVASAGHEIGNHSMKHKCSENYSWSRGNALEDCTLDYMAHDLDVSNEAIRSMLGIYPISFAYPCGQTFVGRGADVKSYVPLVIKRFTTGRIYGSTVPNDPTYCDFAQLTCINSDGLSWKQLKSLIDDAAAKGSWLIIGSHEIGRAGYQTISDDTLTAFCKYVKDPRNGLWVAPVKAISGYIAATRAADQATGGTILRQHVSLPILYARVIKMFCIGCLIFLFSFIIQTKAPYRISRCMMVIGAALLMLWLIWLMRYGFVGYYGLTGVFCVLSYCLGSWSSMVWHNGSKGSKRGEKGR